MENYCRRRKGSRDTGKEATAVVQLTSNGGLGRGCGHGNREVDELTGLAEGLDV